ncbi:MAG: hypothetical protein HKN14_06675 [Marinicaulis sp.]|nr:hypothetical protein [Marinicaulis sp.]NNE40587.1 hypothetical protein [Marinicaulis sp.]NNL88201.1 hypothetical protein [Marinicaulis sp.]
MTRYLCIFAFLLCGFSTSGCVIAAAAAGGAIAADEIGEKDGKFDPLEDAYDGDESTEVLSDDG